MEMPPPKGGDISRFRFPHGALLRESRETGLKAAGFNPGKGGYRVWSGSESDSGSLEFYDCAAGYEC